MLQLFSRDVSIVVCRCYINILGHIPIYSYVVINVNLCCISVLYMFMWVLQLACAVAASVFLVSIVSAIFGVCCKAFF
jgi:hypothetical protein